MPPQLLDVVFLFEFFDAAGGIDELLLLGVEGVAARADLNVKVLRRRFRFDLGAARAFYYRFFVFGMYIRFHCTILGL